MKIFYCAFVTSLLALSALLGVWQAMKYDYFRRAAVSEAYHDIRRTIEMRPYVKNDSAPRITFWGDSLTAGYSTTLGHEFPALLTFIYHRAASNQGIPRETSNQIRDRFLARPHVDGPEHVVVWAGRNNADRPDDVEADIAKMIASLNAGSQYLVLGVTNADFEPRGNETYERIIKLNKNLAATYGSRFVPVRDILVSKANRRDPDDLRNLGDDVIPISLRTDAVHLNDLGQAIVATTIEEALVANGW